MLVAARSEEELTLESGMSKEPTQSLIVSLDRESRALRTCLDRVPIFACEWILCSLLYTFLAFGNGSPDVFSTFAAMGSNSGSMAVGELIGAAGFTGLR